ncbi:hypothetical protein B9Z19DRAFT_1134991 [Tuber borchii]|uniref:Uncharacterized protein n=1 Tax=Tuber borchii TaxID=42251 RepID=A0A2T6ZDK2_TUBBO|nr:hypothetical protein B9Z19DRAFT_1134991 [Tuber borchii]
MPPQLLWSVGDNGPDNPSLHTPPVPSKFTKVRYLSLTPNGELDFDYWPTGNYEQISRLNRDLLTPPVTGWGTDAQYGWTLAKVAIELQGVWAIGDALLGLISWHSPLVQLELHELFDAGDGGWFNSEFANEIEARVDRKLASMLETLEKVHNGY